MRRKSLADILRTEIKASGLTIYAICKETGLDQAQMGKFMKGRQDIKLETADILCRFLGLTIRKEDHANS